MKKKTSKTKSRIEIHDEVGHKIVKILDEYELPFIEGASLLCLMLIASCRTMDMQKDEFIGLVQAISENCPIWDEII